MPYFNCDASSDKIPNGVDKPVSYYNPENSTIISRNFPDTKLNSQEVFFSSHHPWSCLGHEDEKDPIVSHSVIKKESPAETQQWNQIGLVFFLLLKFLSLAMKQLLYFIKRKNVTLALNKDVKKKIKPAFQPGVNQKTLLGNQNSLCYTLQQYFSIRAVLFWTIFDFQFPVDLGSGRMYDNRIVTSKYFSLFFVAISSSGLRNMDKDMAIRMGSLHPYF